MSTLNVMLIVGTRPEAIKMAPLIKALKERSDLIQSTVVATGQHRQMLDQVLKLFDIQPDFDLNVMQDQQNLSDITIRALRGLETILKEVGPDMMLAEGDTTSVFIGGLAAFYQSIPVGHVEAGLRTYDKFNPFPEEMNRRLLGALADLHFAPTATAKNNLLREGVLPNSIFLTGNTVIDALLDVSHRYYQFEDTALNRVDFNRKVILVTAHRRENWGQPLVQICQAIRELVERHNDVEVVFPVHLNPRVGETVRDFLGHNRRIHLTQPLDYLPFVHVMKRCHLILTDSGGVQEEAPSLGKPVLVLRKVTERPEAVEAGVVKVVGTESSAIAAEASRLLTDQTEYNRMSQSVNPYGDGHAAQRIVQAILYYFDKRVAPPTDFNPEKHLKGFPENEPT